MVVIKERVEFPKWIGAKPLIPYTPGPLLPSLRSPGEIHMNWWSRCRKVPFEIRSRF